MCYQPGNTIMDSEEKIKWCLKQKRGIKIVEPSDNLCKIYLEKAREALKAAIINSRYSINSWAISASYYAKYFSIYALLSKIGIKSEIHDCTIELFSFLFKDKVDEGLIKDIKRSKESRIEFQYYSPIIKPKVDHKKLESETRKFIEEIEKLIENLKEEEIKEIRNRLKRMELTRVN